MQDRSGFPLVVGGKYHVDGMNYKAYFVLLGVTEEWALLGYPKKTWRRPFSVKAERLTRLKGKRIK